MSTETPLVTVIIPTYNRGWILKEAVDSVLDQEFRDFQLVVVDDGSTDDTAGILASYGDRIKVITRENGGVSAARNSAIRETDSPYIALLDSDDLWLPGKLAEQVRFFREHPEAHICQTEEIWIRRGVRVNPKKKHKKPSGDIFEKSLHLCLVSPSAVMFTRSLVEEVGLFDESLPACEDYDLWLRVGCRYPVHLIDTPLILKRGGHEDQLSSAAGLDKYRILSLKKIIESGDLSRDQAHSATEVLVRKCEIYAGGCRKRGRMEEAGFFAKVAEKFDAIEDVCG